MRPHVHLELGALGEAVAARLAAERLLVGVRAQVLQEVALERALAHRALERLHAAVVAAEVLAQAVRPGERLAAHRARVVPLAGVPPQVHLIKLSLKPINLNIKMIEYFEVR